MAGNVISFQKEKRLSFGVLVAKVARFEGSCHILLYGGAKPHICMMQLNVYLFMTLRQSKLSGSSTNRKSTPMKTSELRIDSGVSFRGKSVEFAPKIT